MIFKLKNKGFRIPVGVKNAGIKKILISHKFSSGKKL